MLHLVPAARPLILMDSWNAWVNSRRSLGNQKSLQKYLNLFVLWYNSHLFERGKRKGKSPFEWANMDLPEGDWLLCFPKSS